MCGLIGILTVMAAVVLAGPVLGSTVVPGGNVSGTWTTAGSPYLVEGDIAISAADLLVIEPGVEVRFQPQYGLTVQGALQAAGAVQDSVIFTATDSELGWDGILADANAAASTLDYCVVTFGTGGTSTNGVGGGINCRSPLLTLSHSRFSHNHATSGGAIHILVGEGSVSISDCTISANEAINQGGGISVAEMHMELTRCLVEFNRVTGPSDDYQSGGGVYCFGFLSGSAEITGCTFRENTGHRNGGGLCIEGGLYGGVNIAECDFIENLAMNGSGGGVYLSGVQADVMIADCGFVGNWMFPERDRVGGALYSHCTGNLTVSRCTFGSNYAAAGGTAYCTRGNTTVESCTFSHNHDGYLTKAGALVLDCDATVTNTIIANQYMVGSGNPPLSAGIHFLSGTHTVQYCDFYNNGVGRDFLGVVPAGLGEPVAVNVNGDSCDVFSNIVRNPLFCGAPDDLTIAEISPCLGAGEAGTDIGALGVGCELSPVPECSAPGADLLGRNYPNPFNPGTNFEITVPTAGHVRVEVFDLRGRLVATLVDETLARGVRTIAWDGFDDRGEAVGSGVYVCRLQTPDHSATGRMTLLK